MSYCNSQVLTTRFSVLFHPRRRNHHSGIAFLIMEAKKEGITKNYRQKLESEVHSGTAGEEKIVNRRTAKREMHWY